MGGHRERRPLVLHSDDEGGAPRLGCGRGRRIGVRSVG